MLLHCLAAIRSDCTGVRVAFSLKRCRSSTSCAQAVRTAPQASLSNKLHQHLTQVSKHTQVLLLEQGLVAAGVCPLICSSLVCAPRTVQPGANALGLATTVLHG